MTSWIDQELAALEARDLRRHPSVMSSAQEAEVEVDGERLILLASNNYLGLAADPRVRRAAADAALLWGAGAGASRLVSGTLEIHRELERELARLKGCEDAIGFSSGYLANVGTICALVGAGDAVFSDALNHASIIDGCRQSGAEIGVYRHADADHLAGLLAASSARRKLVVTDTVFSMDGDLAPLSELLEACRRQDAMLMVDEAHATGVVGQNGAGAVEDAGLAGLLDVVMGTLSKALGSAGGFVAGSSSLVEWLRNRARTHVFDTAPTPAATAAAQAALRISSDEPWRRERVRTLATTLASELRSLGFEVPHPAAAVVPVLVGDAREAIALAQRLRERGVFCPAIRPPSVPEGTARLRATVMATHTDEHLEIVLDAFAGRTSIASRDADPLGPIRDAGGVFVTGTDTGVGKTVVAAAVARTLTDAGLRVGILKPAQTGTDAGADDATFAAELAGCAANAVAYSFGEPLAPAVAARRAGVEIRADVLQETFDRLREKVDVVVVEGAGGLLVELADGYTMADLSSQLGLPVLVTARPGLGTLNHTALTVEAARRRGLHVLGVVISGMASDPDIASETNVAELPAVADVQVLGIVPELPGLDTERGVMPATFEPADWLTATLGGDHGVR